jgi:hypothetical protein
MIEFTVLDLVLLVWAGLATSLALHFFDKERSHKTFVTVLIENKSLREEFFNKIDEHNEEKRA